MKRCITFLVGIVALTPASLVADTRAEQDRLQNAGKVMQEVLRIPDGIPQDLLGRKITTSAIIRESSVEAAEAGRNLTVTLQKASPQLKP